MGRGLAALFVAEQIEWSCSVIETEHSRSRDKGFVARYGEKEPKIIPIRSMHFYRTVPIKFKFIRIGTYPNKGTVSSMEYIICA